MHMRVQKVFLVFFLKDEVPDQSEEKRPQCDSCNFTSPLPFHASSPTTEATVQEGSGKDASQQQQQLQDARTGAEEVIEQQSEAPGNELQEGAELNEEDVLEETQSEMVEKTQEDDVMVVEDGEKEGVSLNSSTAAQPDVASTARTTSSQSASLAADRAAPCRPDPLNCIQKSPPATKASHLTKHDKRIIEKIRSYYEAAAKAEEDEAEQDSTELEEGAESRRRNSFSHIPSGLVKESVSRFDDCGHLGEPESEQSQSESHHHASHRNQDPTCRTDCPGGNPSGVLPDPQDDGEADKTKCSQTSLEESELSTASKVMDNPGQVALIQNCPAQVDNEGKESHREANRESAEGVLEVDQEEQEAPVAAGQEHGPHIAKENISREETGAIGNGEHMSPNEQECELSSSTEPHRSPKELPKEPVACEEPWSKSSAKHQSSWVRKKPRDLTKLSRNVEGQWSHHSRIVTSNRALFETMGSDVASIGLFEATPEVDPVLIENSERILSKVQTLAQMFGAKAGSMKVPLHQKRGTSAQAPPWDTARLSEKSLHGHNKNKTRVQHNGKEPKESENEPEAKIINQNNVFSQSQEKTREERKAQEQKTFTQSSGKFLKKLGSPSPYYIILKICVCHQILANLK